MGTGHIDGCQLEETNLAPLRPRARARARSLILAPKNRLPVPSARFSVATWKRPNLAFGIWACPLNSGPGANN
jgi:hypothetical protein